MSVVFFHCLVSSIPSHSWESSLRLWKLSNLHTLHTPKSSGRSSRRKNCFERSSRDSISLKRTEQWWRHTFRRIVSNNNFFIVFVVFLYLLRVTSYEIVNVIIVSSYKKYKKSKQERKTSPGILCGIGEETSFFSSCNTVTQSLEKIGDRKRRQKRVEKPFNGVKSRKY